MPRVYEVAGDVITGCKCSDHQHHQHGVSLASEVKNNFATPGQAPSYAPSLDMAPIHMEIHMDIQFQPVPSSTNRVIVTFHDARPVTTESEAEKRAAGVCVSRVDPFSGVPTPDLIEVQGKSSISLNASGFAQVAVRTVSIPVSARASLERVNNEDPSMSGESEVATTVPVEFFYDGKCIVLEWDRPFRPNEARSVEISYKVENPPTGLIFGPKQNPTWVASDHETERAHYWLPCVDLPAVRTNLDFFITASEDKTILANGLLVEEMKGSHPGSKTAHWRLDTVVCPSYLLCIAVGNFVEFDDGEFVDELAKQNPPTSGDVTPQKIKYFGVASPAGDGATPQRLAQSFRETPAMMQWLSQLLQVPFPFPKYYQFIIQGVGGAMENISLVSWDEVFLLDERLATEFQTYTDMVNIHEMGHSYFGDLVVCRHFDHAWLKEGWATYCEYLWLFDHRGADTALWYMLREGESYMKESRNAYSRPLVTNVYDHSWNMYDNHLYPGGAWRLHMLMHTLGRVAFFRGVNMYLRENQGKVVETDTFRHCLERASGGRNLTEFFQQWVYGRGFPEVSAERTFSNGTLTVNLKQTQDFKENGACTGHGFSITLEVCVEIEQGVWRLEPAVFDSNGVATVSFSQLPRAPLQIVIDPYHKVLHRLQFDPGFDCLARTATSYSPSVPIGNELASSGQSNSSTAALSTVSVTVSGFHRARAAALLLLK